MGEEPHRSRMIQCAQGLLVIAPKYALDLFERLEINVKEEPTRSAVIREAEATINYKLVKESEFHNAVDVLRHLEIDVTKEPKYRSAVIEHAYKNLFYDTPNALTTFKKITPDTKRALEIVDGELRSNPQRVQYVYKALKESGLNIGPVREGIIENLDKNTFFSRRKVSRLAKKIGIEGVKIERKKDC
jgi:hypothetical protein